MKMTKAQLQLKSYEKQGIDDPSVWQDNRSLDKSDHGQDHLMECRDEDSGTNNVLQELCDQLIFFITGSRYKKSAVIKFKIDGWLISLLWHVNTDGSQFVPL